MEDLFNNTYKCFSSQSEYFYNDNTDNLEIYKIHGTAEFPNSLVLTQNDYAKFNNLNYLSVSKLISTISERPIIFLGYSLSDPNICVIIDKILQCLTEKQLNRLQKNIIFIEWQKSLREMKPGTKIYALPNSSKSLSATFIKTDNFIKLYDYLLRFQPCAKPSEIRRLKLLIKNLIETNDPRIQTYLVKSKELSNINDSVAITELGASLSGYDKIPLEELLLDVLYDKGTYDPLQVIDKWIMTRFSTNTYAPIYFYLNKIRLTVDEFSNNIDEIKEKLKSFHKSKKQAYKKLFEKVSSAPNAQSFNKELNKQKKIPAKILFIAKSFYVDNYIDREQCVKALQKIYEMDNTAIKLTEMKKAVTLLDFNPNLKI